MEKKLPSLQTYKLHPKEPILGKGNHEIVFYVTDGKREHALKVECAIEHRGNPLSKGKIDMHRLEILSSQAFDKLRKSHVLDHVVKTTSFSFYKTFSIGPNPCGTRIYILILFPF